MSQYVDNNGEVHQIEFDAYMLHMIKVDTGLDFADLGAGAYEMVDANEIELVRVLARICGVQFKTFAKTCTGDAITSGKEAILEAAADFFPPLKWSELQVSLTKRKAAREELAEMRTAMELMPDEMKQGANEALAEVMKDQIATTGSGESQK